MELGKHILTDLIQTMTCASERLVSTAVLVRTQRLSTGMLGVLGQSADGCREMAAQVVVEMMEREWYKYGVCLSE